MVLDTFLLNFCCVIIRIGFVFHTCQKYNCSKYLCYFIIYDAPRYKCIIYELQDQRENNY